MDFRRLNQCQKSNLDRMKKYFYRRRFLLGYVSDKAELELLIR